MTQDWSCRISESSFRPVNDEVYLLLMHVNLQPAHLVILFNDAVYSLTNKIVDIGRPFNSLERVIHRRSIPCLIIQLVKPNDTAEIPEILESVFNQFEPLSSNGETCLNPIKLSLEKIFKLTIDAKLVFDILEFFESRRMIGKVEAIHIPAGQFVLKLYTIEDVNNQIRRLQNS